jgi:predicted TPR repeat methyltransferase
MSRLDTLREYLAKKPGDRFAMYSVALELEKSGDTTAAEAAYNELLEAHPTSGAGHLRLGMLLKESGRASEAAEAWRRGLVALRGATDAEARRSIGEIERALDALEDES